MANSGVMHFKFADFVAGTEAGMALIDAMLERGGLKDTCDSRRFLQKVGRAADAVESYRTALALAHQEPPRRLHERPLMG
jgi:predicted RNA polymerase sigma factor